MKRTQLLLILIILLVSVIACNKNDISNPKVEDLIKLSEIEIKDGIYPILQSYLAEQYSYFVGESSAPSWVTYQVDKENLQIKNKIDHLKSELKSINIFYTDYTGKVIISSLSKGKYEVSINLIHKFSIKSNQVDPDSPGNLIATEGEQIYQAKMKLVNEVWFISEFTSIGDDPWYIDLTPTIDQNIEFNSTPENLLSYTYNPTNAKNYAYLYWSTPNPTWCNYASGGGDCTNFLSQCLKSGGWTTNSSWWASGSSCCNQTGCIATCYSCNWTVAHNFKNYVVGSGRIYSACYLDNALNVGDIIQLKNTSGSVYHSTLVTKRTVSGTIVNVYVTYRNGGGYSPYKDRLSTMLGGTHLGWKVKSSAN